MHPLMLAEPSDHIFQEYLLRFQVIPTFSPVRIGNFHPEIGEIALKYLFQHLCLFIGQFDLCHYLPPDYISLNAVILEIP